MKSKKEAEHSLMIAIEETKRTVKKFMLRQPRFIFITPAKIIFNSWFEYKYENE